MIKRTLISLSFCGCSLLYAQSRTEIELRTRMAAMQKTLDDSVKERAKLAAELAKVGNTAKAVAKNQAQAQADAEVASQIVAAKVSEAKEVVARTAKEAADAAAAAQAATSSARAQNAALLIVQSFALLALLMGIGERLWNRRKDRERETRDHQWKLEAETREKDLAASVNEVHGLVNSAYTAALMETLDAMKAALVLLRANVVLLRAAVPRDEVAIREVALQSVLMAARVADLTKVLASRAKAGCGGPLEEKE